MDTPESQAHSHSELDELQQQCFLLRQQVMAVLALFTLITVTLCAYTYCQLRYLRSDLTAEEKVLAAYDKTEGPRTAEFINKLVEYGKTHPDFAPIVNKYHLQTVPPANK